MSATSNEREIHAGAARGAKNKSSGSKRRAVLGSLAVLVGAGAFVATAVRAQRAQADGVPQTDSFYAVGTLDIAGRPDNAQHNIVVRLFNEETGGTMRCQSSTLAAMVINGQFRIDFEMCRATVRSSPDLWVELTIDSNTFPRTKLGAVPYALEAARASGASGTIDARLTALESGTADCPAGYERANPTEVSPAPIVCRKGRDEMVRVGDRAGVFWIDRYESSLFASADGMGAQSGLAAGDIPASFPDDGDYTTPLFAISVTGVVPSRFMTWFQASEACRAAGERLPTTEEWVVAAAGTPEAGECLVSGTEPRRTGEGMCASRWGARDMAGSLWEWGDGWLAAPGTGTAATNVAWPRFATAGTARGIASGARVSAMGATGGLPAAELHGGSYEGGAGVYAYSLRESPLFGAATYGFRCVRTR